MYRVRHHGCIPDVTITRCTRTSQDRLEGPPLTPALGGMPQRFEAPTMRNWADRFEGPTAGPRTAAELGSQDLAGVPEELPEASRPPTWPATWTWGLGRIASKVPPLAPGRPRIAGPSVRGP